MPAVVEKELCTACKSCEEACPTTSITIPEDCAIVKAEDCIDCNACVDVCTTGAIKME
jgi:NAD-dependent dihydropyrimidine dehydrogenase PreA subunit